MHFLADSFTKMPNYHTWNDSPTTIVIIDASSLLSHGLTTFPDMFNLMQLEGNTTTRSNGNNLCSLYIMQKPFQLIYKQDSGKLKGFELQNYKVNVIQFTITLCWLKQIRSLTLKPFYHNKKAPKNVPETFLIFLFVCFLLFFGPEHVLRTINPL